MTYKFLFTFILSVLPLISFAQVVYEDESYAATEEIPGEIPSPPQLGREPGGEFSEIPQEEQEYDWEDEVPVEEESGYVDEEGEYYAE